MRIWRSESSFPARTALWLCGDAFLYCLLVYAACLISLLHFEGLYSTAGAVARAAPVVGLAVLLEIGAWKTGARTRRGSSWVGVLTSVLWVAAFVAAFLIGPALFAGMAPSKGYSNAWLPLDWVKFRFNYFLLLETSPLSFAAVILLPILLIFMRFTLGWRVLPPFLLALLALGAAYVLKYAFWIEGSSAYDRDLGHFAFPILVPVAALLFGLRKLGSRSLVMTWLFCSVGLFYVGVYPFEKFPELNPICPAGLRTDVEKGKPNGVRRLYPSGNEDSKVLLSFLREMVFDESGRLYVSFGPTSGLLEVDTGGGGLNRIANVHGVMRSLLDVPGRNTILGLDFFDADVVLFRKKPLGVTRRVDLYGETGLSTPIDFALDLKRDRLYVVNYEGCALIEMELSSFRKLREIRFPTLGLQRFRNGGQCLAYDSERGKIYVLIGFVDLDLGWKLARVDAQKMEVEGTVDLPYGGMSIQYFAATSSVFSGSFWTDDLFEIETEPFRLKRRMRGPLSCRNLAYDRKRRVLYASSYARGEVLAIDYDTGEVERHLHLGPKVSSMLFEEKTDTLYAGCGSGIWAMDMDRLLGPAATQ